MQKADLKQKLKETMAKRETVTEDMIQALTPECYEEIILSCDSRFFDELADMWNESSNEANYTADDIFYLIDRFERGVENLLRSKVMFQKIKTFTEEHDHILAQNNPPTMR